jgi:hypothetical protein
MRSQLGGHSFCALVLGAVVGYLILPDLWLCIAPELSLVT